MVRGSHLGQSRFRRPRTKWSVIVPFTSALSRGNSEADAAAVLNLVEERETQRNKSQALA